MRKIENEMLQAIKSRVSAWHKDNTAVYYISAGESGNQHGGRSEVFLHGNHIGTYWHESGIMEPNTATVEQWPTNTTLSRLRALGISVGRKKGVVVYS